MSTKKTTRSSKLSTSPPPPAKPSIWRRILGWLAILADFLKMIPLVGFVLRYWVLLVIIVLLAMLIFSKMVYAVAGVFVWVPFLTLVSMAAALLLRNVFNRDTTDADADSGRFVKEWNAIDPKTRVILTVVQTLVYFLGACIACGFLSNGVK